MKAGLYDMKDISDWFAEMLIDKKKLPYLIGGALLAVLLLAAVLILLFGGSGRKYQRLYAEAETAFRAQEYEQAEEKLRRALDLKSTEDAYLLMADIYCAKGETDRAIQMLYLGYSRLGGDAMAQRLEELKSGGGSVAAESPRPQKPVVIADNTATPDVTSLVLAEKQLTREDCAAISDLRLLESLSVSDCGLTEVSFLSALSELTFLQISDNSVSDLRPLSSLRNLKTLYIDRNPVTDLTPLYSLTKLRTLSMKGIDVTDKQLDELRKALPECSVSADEPEAEVKDVSFAGRTISADVTELDLSAAGLRDISPLRALKNLQKLDLRDNQITDISPLMDLQNLKWLCIWNNQVEDIYPLVNLSGLTYLDADGNRISDISVIENLRELDELWLNHNPLDSVEPIRSLERLTHLGLADTGMDDDKLDCLMELTALRELNIKGNPDITAEKFDELQEALSACTIKHDELLYTVSFGSREFTSDAEELEAMSQDIADISPLEKFTKLRTLNLSGNRITDLSPLKDLKELAELRLYGNRVGDLSPLDGHSALRVLDLQDNFVRDLSPLAGCMHLRTLLLSDNGILSVTPLAACTELTELDLDNNDVSDLSPLAPLTSMETLHLENNQISDLSALYSLVQLKTLYVRGNPLTADDIRALQTMLPNCVVIHDLVLSEDDLNPAETTATPAPASPSNLG